MLTRGRNSCRSGEHKIHWDWGNPNLYSEQPIGCHDAYSTGSPNGNRVGLCISLPDAHLFNSSPPSVAYMHLWTGSALVQIMACRMFGTKPLPEINAGLLSIGPLGTHLSEIRIEVQHISFMKMHLKLSSVKWRPFCPWGNELKSATQHWSISCAIPTRKNKDCVYGKWKYRY